MKHFCDTVEDFIRAYFDKILLTALFLVLVGIAAQGPDQLSSWAREQANTVLGAIILLTTGAIIRKVNGAKPPDVPKD